MEQPNELVEQPQEIGNNINGQAESTPEKKQLKDLVSQTIDLEINQEENAPSDRSQVPQLQQSKAKKGSSIEEGVKIGLTPNLPDDKEKKQLKDIVEDKLQQTLNLAVTLQIDALPESTVTKVSKVKRQHKQKQSQQSLQNNKFLKLIFSHFCKENYISSIKSTLFEEKQKIMEEMNLNKWMVFCKQFDIFSKLCSQKIQEKQNQQSVSETQRSKQASRVRQLKVKQIKQVQKMLTHIFKKSAENHTKMYYNNFTQAISLLNQEFRHTESLSPVQFAKKYLFCQSQDGCLQKLANLKFTFGIPQIDYTKAISTPFPKEKEKSRMTPKQQQENDYCELPSKKSTVKLHPNNKARLNLNPIIKEAKNTLATIENKSTISGVYKETPKMKLNVNQPKRLQKKAEKLKQKSALLKFFDETEDEILESYFNSEKTNTAYK